MPTPRSKEDWKSLIEPHLSTSLRTASDHITRTEAIQSWLHDASMEAAEGLGEVSGLQGEMQGYVRMMNALEDRFPQLLAAVDDLTEGCGRVDLHWRPLNPNFSRLYVAFDRDFTVQVFDRLMELSREDARAGLKTVTEALPDGTPFPNRPNTVTGLLAFEGRCIGVRMQEHLADDRQRRYRTVTLLPKNHENVEPLSPDEAPTALLQWLAPADSPSSSV